MPNNDHEVQWGPDGYANAYNGYPLNVDELQERLSDEQFLTVLHSWVIPEGMQIPVGGKLAQPGTPMFVAVCAYLNDFVPSGDLDSHDVQDGLDSHDVQGGLDSHDVQGGLVVTDESAAFVDFGPSMHMMPPPPTVVSNVSAAVTSVTHAFHQYHPFGYYFEQ
jgi:hypothetical protein